MSIQPAKKTVRTMAPALFDGQSYPEPQGDDFVEHVLAVVASLVPGADRSVMAAADAALRERWGGDRPYIARRVGEGRSQRNDAIRRDYLAGERFELLERRYGLTRRRLMQIVKLG